MKKIYTLIAVSAFSLLAHAQNSEAGKFQLNETKPYFHSTSQEKIAFPDTTGISDVTNFLPSFASISGSAAFYSYGSATLKKGYIYGNNGSTFLFNECAQGYTNLNATTVKVVGAICWFGGKQRDAAGGAASKVVVNAYSIAANMACNTNGSGTFNQSTLNSNGPAATASASSDLLFDNIDTTTFSNANYVTFATPPVFSGDFAIGVNFASLTVGDTVGLVSDNVGDAANLDYAFLHSGATGKWYVADEVFSAAASPTFGSGSFDNDIAIFAVLDAPAGVDEYFNGMKLTTYPNPSVDKATIEYTLEKNSKNVSLIVFDEKGSKIVNNVYSDQSAGTYKVNIETTKLSSGNYFYQLNANGHNFTKKFVVTK